MSIHQQGHSFFFVILSYQTPNNDTRHDRAKKAIFWQIILSAVIWNVCRLANLLFSVMVTDFELMLVEQTKEGIKAGDVLRFSIHAKCYVRRFRHFLLTSLFVLWVSLSCLFGYVFVRVCNYNCHLTRVLILFIVVTECC